MNFTLTIAPAELSRLKGVILDKLDALRNPVQSAMATALKGVVDANFGSVGFDRPWKWDKLSKDYRRRVGRDFATLYVSGALKNSVRKDTSNAEASSVSMSKSDVVYALAHHHGYAKNNLPARRVFPLDLRNNVTPKTINLLRQAASIAARGAL